MKTFLIFIFILFCLSSVCTSIVKSNRYSTTRSNLNTASQLNSQHFSESTSSHQERTINDFATRDSRMGFIRKVYGILVAQVLTTMFSTYLIMTNSAIGEFLILYQEPVSIVSFLVSSGILHSLFSFRNLCYKSPINFILLGVFTLLQSIMVGIFARLVDPELVYLGAVHTLSVFLAITLYSFQPVPRYDLTNFGGVLLVSLTSLTVATFLNAFYSVPFVSNLLSASAAALFAIYLLYDTQLIVGGKHHKRKYGQKDYILAALSVYQDLLILFIEIVKILVQSKRSKSSDE